ncbi:patatin-like phospholipase family protein [Sorangium sp. So ce291]|uniref:patatin-like phospholipase family protein n=1 Tax=Sorangium sp. So ce291 TaxID=3133294 RepID=UPI003F5F9CA1
MSDGSRECDLVMKGGITSGIVYPPAVLRLHEDGYRFLGIGGASAGAIAAAATAAAQHGESTGGFEKLRALSDSLGEKGLLLKLFQPIDEMRPLFEIAVEVQRRVAARRAKSGDGRAGAPAGPARHPASEAEGATEQSLFWFIARRLPRVDAILRERGVRSYAVGHAAGGRWGALVGAAVGAVLLMVSLPWTLLASRAGTELAGAPAVACAVAAGVGCFALGRLLGGWLAVAWDLFAGKLPQRGLFGICTGHSGDPRNMALTDWLYENINAMAGKEPSQPLTFEDLARATGGAKGVELKMVATDLSYARPYVLPFTERSFLFKGSEMRKLFPAAVVDYMIAEGKRGRRSEWLPDDHHWLPRGDRLPVIVATRMSLSFPVLLSAVPLYRLNAAATKRLLQERRRRCDPDADLEKHWFSDGGIASNFPIHFFDRWLPDRPTFGISLASSDDESAGPSLPEARNTRATRPMWEPIESLRSFLWSIIDTSMGFRDGMQSELPSYRERIVQIPLAAGQGGLNLAMAPDVIKDMQRKGTEAGRLLATEFKFDQHRWVRFCVLTEHLERELVPLKELFLGRESYAGVFTAQEAAYRLAGQEKDVALRWYRPRDGLWCAEATRRMKALMTVVDGWQQATEVQFQLPFFGRSTPSHDSALRITPEV